MATTLAYAPISLPKRYPLIRNVEGSIAFAADTVSNPLRIDPSGLLLGLMLSFVGTNTTGATAPVANNSSPYGLISGVNLSTGGGVGQSINVSGYELNVAERTREPGYLDDPTVGVAASTTNALKFSLWVPVCVRLGDLYAEWTDLLGSIFTGDPTVTCSLRITWGDAGAIFNNQATAAAVIAGTLTVESFKLDTPNPDQDPMLLAAISWVHQVIEEREDQGANQMPYVMPTNEPRVYLRIWDLYGDGASPNFTWKNGVVTELDFSLQDYLHFYQDIPEQSILDEQIRAYSPNALPAGTYVLDLARSMYRTQWLPVNNVTLFKNSPTVTSPGASPILRVVQESVVPSPLARKWMASAQAAGMAVAAA